jgi:two-component system, NtrC family, response regulator
MANILIIDDDVKLCEMICRHLKYQEHFATFANDLKEGSKKLKQTDFDIVFLDVRLPDGNGLDYLPLIVSSSSQPEVIIITGEGSQDGAELAITHGAWDYIEKPISISKIVLPTERALKYRQEKSNNRLPSLHNRKEIIGKSPAIQDSLLQAAFAAACDSNVLITGETGTGKEVFARVIHNNSKRLEKEMVVIDCAAMPENLVESSLFGHVKGAFTSADKTEDGLIVSANGGTLFLDEIGEMSLNMQKKFLRVLQEHRFRQIGGKVEKKSDFRLVAATNRNLNHMVKQGAFREDLLYRINSLCIHLPALRDRQGDIEDLAKNYFELLVKKNKLEDKKISPDYFDILNSYAWPGNVRELFNVVEQSLHAAKFESTLFSKHLPTHIRVAIARQSVNSKSTNYLSQKGISDDTVALPTFKSYRLDAIAIAEKTYFKQLLFESKGQVEGALKISGISRSRFFELLKKYNLSTKHSNS